MPFICFDENKVKLYFRYNLINKLVIKLENFRVIYEKIFKTIKKIYNKIEIYKNYILSKIF